MAEFGLASNLLSTIASPGFRKPYERLSLTDDVHKIMMTIVIIQYLLLGAERKKQQTSDHVKLWIDKVRDVLCDAADLFDQVTTDYLLEQQIRREDSRFFRKVRLFSSISMPRSSIAKAVKSIRNSLLEISADKAVCDLVISAKEKPANVKTPADLGSFVYPYDVIGRDEDKEAILEMLFDESIDGPVITIVGIGGMGKSTLSHLIYSDVRVVENFDKRWFVCISKTSDDKQFLGKIFQSITGESFTDFSVLQLASKIQKSMADNRFLLVLDDVWDEDHWFNHQRFLLSEGFKGSRIIVTTRSLSVARAIGASKTYKLGGLSDDASWELFKMVAFTPEQEKDPRWDSLGREIVRKCANVPLVIKSVASLLYSKSTIKDWELYGESSIMDTLKLSYYDDLTSSMKQCFAYCSLFPKDSEFEIKKLVNLWIAQGYTWHSYEQEKFHREGYSCFMYLLRRGLFEEEIIDEYGEVVTCKMHALVHDLAQDVARKDIILLTWKSNQFKDTALHVGVDCERGNPGEILELLVNNKRLRSLVIMNGGSCDLTLDQRFTNLRFLRALGLSDLGIVNVSDSVGELKHLRYLDLSHNSFVSLPDSMTSLVNLLTLDIEGCYNLKKLPDNFRKLVNLRCLNNKYCYELKHMPPGIGELACLQYLSSFKVGKTTQEVKRSDLDALAELKQLTGELLIDFQTGIEDWDGDERWQLPVSPQRLHIWEYPGRRIPCWGSERTNSLSNLQLGSCSEVRYLPPLRSLPHLKILSLRGLWELEYMEEEEIEVISSAGLFFPCLEQLELRDLPKLKGWSTRTSIEQHSLPSFLHLSQLTMINSPEFKSIPLSPCVRKLELYSIDSELVQQQLLSPSPLEDLSITNCQGLLDFPIEALASLRSFCIDRLNSLETLRLLSPNLSTVLIKSCQELKSLEVGPLRSLKIEYCNRLTNLQIAPPGVLEELFISDCPELKLWESQDERRPLDWDPSPTSKASLSIQFPLHRSFLTAKMIKKSA